MAASAPIESVVLGVDEGDYSWEALGMARTVAGSAGAELVAFHAGRDEVPDIVTERAADGGVTLRSQTLAPDAGVADAIVAEAAGMENAVVALTSHARRGITAALIGSTAAAVLEVSSSPVLLFGPQHDTPDPPPRILACIDGSHHSEAILPAACRWARATGLELWLVHVVEPDVSIAAGGADGNYVHRVAERLDADDIDIEHDVLHGDHPGKTIADYANHQPGTITALATHGRSGLRQVTMGSVAMEVTRRSTGPTLVLRPS